MVTIKSLSCGIQARNTEVNSNSKPLSQLKAQGMALLQDPDVELELLLALLLPALEPAAEDLTGRRHSSEGGEAGDARSTCSLMRGGSRDLQAVAVG